MPPNTSTRSRKWWVVQQHETITTEEAEKRPDSKVKAGERHKRVFGPYADERTAKDAAEEMYSRTLKALGERGAF